MRPSGIRVAWTIARRELIDQACSLRFLAILFLVLLMTPLSIYVGVKDYQARLNDYNRLSESKQEFLRTSSSRFLGFDDDSTAANELMVLRVLRAPQPLSILVHGMDGALPKYWDFSELGVQPGPPASTISRLADTFQHLDFEFLIRAVLGLLAALLGYDAVVGEKEAGTLRTALSHPISRRLFFTGKLLGGTITLLLALTLAFAIALLCFAWMAPSNLFDWSVLNKLGLIGITSAAYLICFYLMGLIVSSLTSSQKTSLLVTLVAWFLLVLTVAPVATLIARAAVPVQTFQSFDAKRSDLEKKLSDRTAVQMGEIYREVTGARKGAVSRSLVRSNLEELRKRFEAPYQMYLNQRRRKLDVLEQEYEGQQESQQRIAHTIMMLNPALAFADVCTDLAGTGDNHYSSWQSAISNYYQQLEEVLFDRPTTIRIHNGSASFLVSIYPAPNMESLPAFAAPSEDPAAALQRSLPAAGILMLFIILFLVGGFAAFSRYDVR